MGGGGKTQTTTTQVQIPDEVKPLLTQYLGRASALSQGSPSNTMMQSAAYEYPGQTWGALQGIDAAKQGLLGVASGQGYNANPYFDATVDKAMGDITRSYQQGIAPGIDATAARAGAFGGSRWAQQQGEGQRMLAESLGQTANSMRSGNYQQERQNQMQAYGLLPSVSSAGQGVIQNMYGMGQQVQNEGANQLGILGNAISVGMGGAGQSQTGANPNYTSPMQNVLAAAGAAKMVLPFFL